MSTEYHLRRLELLDLLKKTILDTPDLSVAQVLVILLRQRGRFEPPYNWSDSNLMLSLRLFRKEIAVDPIYEDDEPED